MKLFEMMGAEGLKMRMIMEMVHLRRKQRPVNQIGPGRRSIFSRAEDKKRQPSKYRTNG